MTRDNPEGKVTKQTKTNFNNTQKEVEYVEDKHLD